MISAYTRPFPPQDLALPTPRSHIHDPSTTQRISLISPSLSHSSSFSFVALVVLLTGTPRSIHPITASSHSPMFQFTFPSQFRHLHCIISILLFCTRSVASLPVRLSHTSKSSPRGASDPPIFLSALLCLIFVHCWSVFWRNIRISSPLFSPYFSLLLLLELERLFEEF